MTNKSLLTASHIRYLIALKKLHNVYGMKSSDIANELNLSKPSIHNMMDTFLFMGYVEKEPGGRVFLTEHGLQRADFFEDYYKRIKDRLFANGKTDGTAEKAIYALLAELSDESLAMLV